MMKAWLALCTLACAAQALAAASAADAAEVAVQPSVVVEALAQAPAPLPPLAMHVGARAVHEGDEVVVQWPGAWFEAAFSGTGVLFRLGAGEAQWRVRVDGAPVATLLRPAAGWRAITGLPRGAHAVRVELMSEQQAGPARFGGFALPAGAEPLAAPARARQVEFIGDSHTVGYGNASPVRECSVEDVWRTTDDTQAFGPLLARGWNADYRVHAISGRGVVRNYDGFAGDTLPEAYAHVLFAGGAQGDAQGDEPDWHPQLLVIALGTNDFSTPLRAGERWPDREALHADFESRYAAFLQSLHASHPGAWLLVWATDMAGGEIDAEVRKVVERLEAGGDRLIGYVPVSGLAFSGCHFHPSLADEHEIADRLAAWVAARPGLWPAP